MSISISPSPADGALSPSGSPPSVQVTINTSAPAAFAAVLLTALGPVPIEAGFLPAGSTRVRVFLPATLPPGAKLSFKVKDVLGSTADFTYGLG